MLISNSIFIAGSITGNNGIGPPVNQAAPSLSATPKVGTSLSVSVGSWTNSPTFTYQWKRDGVNISGATSQNYTPVTADYNTALSCTVTATNGSGSASADSNSLTTLPANPLNTVLPVISGTAKVGNTLSTNNGTFTGQGTISYTYQWKRNGSDISGATASNYTLITTDYNTAITVVVTASNTGGSTPATSASTASVLPANPVNTVPPAITGTPAVGQTLSTSNGTWTSQATLSYTYQWRRNGTNISGATSSTYLLVGADDGTTITCAVTATNTGGSTTAISSGIGIGDSTPNLLGEKITTTGLKDVWRVGVSNGCSLNIPTGYNCTWSLIDSETLAEETSSVGVSVLYTFTTAMKAYDLRVVVTKGTLSFERYFKRAVTVFPAIFTQAQANVTWDMDSGGFSGFADLGNVDRQGYKIWATGNGTRSGKNGANTIDFANAITTIKAKSTNENLPIHVIFKSKTPGKQMIIETNGYPYPFNVTECQNILFDGCADDALQYAVKFTFGPGISTAGQSIYLRGIEDDGSTTLANAGKGITLAGFEVDGRGGASNARIGSSCTAQAQNFADSDINYSNYQFNKIWMLRMYIHDMLDESLYLGRTGDTDNYGTLSNVRLYNVICENSGNDSIQFGNCNNVEAHNNVFLNSGLRNNSGQRDGIVINPGCRDVAFYQNLILTAPELMQTQTGTKGRNVEVFSNIFVNRISNPASNIFSQASNNVEGFNDIIIKFFNNTLIIPASATNPPFYMFYNSGMGSTKVNPYISADNLIVAANTTQYGVNGNVSSQANWIVNNYITTNIATPGFVDQANNDFHLTSTSSPAFRARQSFTRIHHMAQYDYEGVKWPMDVSGAYSAYEKMT